MNWPQAAVEISSDFGTALVIVAMIYGLTRWFG